MTAPTTTLITGAASGLGWSLARAAFATFAAKEYRPTADKRFSACFAAARLAASLAARRWDDTPTPLSQFVPRAVASRGGHRVKRRLAGRGVAWDELSGNEGRKLRC